MKSIKKSIVDDAAKPKKETELKKRTFVSWLKKSKMQHYHEALKNARTNPKDTWNLLKQLDPEKSK